MPITEAERHGLIGALVYLGRQTSWEDLSYTQLAAAIRRGREVTEEAYCTFYTDAARELAGPGYRKAIAFCDSLLEMGIFKYQGIR